MLALQPPAASGVPGSRNPLNTRTGIPLKLANAPGHLLAICSRRMQPVDRRGGTARGVVIPAQTYITSRRYGRGSHWKIRHQEYNPAIVKLLGHFANVPNPPVRSPSSSDTEQRP